VYVLSCYLNDSNTQFGMISSLLQNIYFVTAASLRLKP